jgi:tripartite-type tricarboxylate transporter receptor subunit TctC
LARLLHVPPGALKSEERLMNRISKAVATCAVLLVAFAQAGQALAQGDRGTEDWPGKQTIKIIVPFSAGSNADLMGRVVASYLAEGLKATFVVENRVGAGGILGTRALAKSPADGYTLCVCSGGAITVPSVTEKGYDPLVELVPVSRVNTQPLVLIVNPKSSMTSVSDVVAMSQTRTGGLSYGSSGAGGLLYNAAEVFRSKTQAQLTHVPFRGGPEAMAALIAGEIDMMFAIMSDAIPHLEAKSVRAIAVTTGVRDPKLSDQPTMIEQGVPGFDIALWNGLFVPQGTPQPIVDRLSTLMLKMPSDANAVKSVIGFGSVLSVTTPDQLRIAVREEAGLWEVGLKDVLRK